MSSYRIVKFPRHVHVHGALPLRKRRPAVPTSYNTQRGVCEAHRAHAHTVDLAVAKLTYPWPPTAVAMNTKRQPNQRTALTTPPHFALDHTTALATPPYSRAAPGVSGPALSDRVPRVKRARTESVIPHPAQLRFSLQPRGKEERGGGRGFFSEQISRRLDSTSR